MHFLVCFLEGFPLVEKLRWSPILVIVEGSLRLRFLGLLLRLNLSVLLLVLGHFLEASCVILFGLLDLLVDLHVLLLQLEAFLFISRILLWQRIVVES